MGLIEKLQASTSPSSPAERMRISIKEQVAGAHHATRARNINMQSTQDWKSTG